MMVNMNLIALLVYDLLATLINYFVTQYDNKNIGTFSMAFIFHPNS